MDEHLVEDTLFWVVKPELSASSVRGLETILSGSYIDVQIGVSTVPSRIFDGLTSDPPVAPETPGLHLQLRSEVLGSIQVGTGIYYRNIEIGKVQQHRLEKDESILVDIFIKPDVSDLRPAGKRFHIVSEDAQSLSEGAPTLHKNIKIGEIAGTETIR